MKVVTIVGTRPELIKLSHVIKLLDKYCEHILIHTGQNYDYELNEVFFKDLDIRKPDYFLDVVGVDLGETVGNIISLSYKYLQKIQPDALLIYGDTNSCLSVYSAKRLKIPVFHMEAGNRCYDQRVPEELNRKIVDHMSDINMTLTDHAKKYLVKEGLPENLIFTVGSSLPEIYKNKQLSIDNSNILYDLNLLKSNYFVVSVHREENVDSEPNLRKFVECLNVIAKHYKKRIIVSTHPRTKKQMEKYDFKIDNLVEFHKPFGFFDYLKLQCESFCVISDSGTITEESSILKFPALTLRKTHERPEGVDKGILIMSSLSPTNIINDIEFTTKHHYNTESVYDYSETSSKVLKIIFSYVNYINENIWKKYD